MQNITDLVTRYTGQPSAPFAELSDEVRTLALELEIVDNELRNAACKLRELATKIESNVNAKADDRVFQLNALGEVNGSAVGRIDALVARRSVIAFSLRMAVRKG